MLSALPSGCYLPSSSDDQGVVEAAKCGAVGERDATLRLMTRAEYNATVRDLLGDSTSPANDFPKEPLAFGFENNADVLRVTAEGAQRYSDAAETLAVHAIRERRDEVTGCKGLDGQACAERMLDTVGRRAFRRTLTAVEKAAFLDLWRRGTMGGESSDGGLEMVLTAILEAPQFLYRSERGLVDESTAGPDRSEAEGETRPVRLGGFEVATRLSYFLWGTMPDDELLDAAEHGRLDTVAGVRVEAERMLDDPRAHAGTASFFRQYLSLETMGNVEKDTTAYPVYSHALAASWRGSLERYVDDAFWNGKTFRALLTMPTVYADAQFSTAYGMTSNAASGTFAKLAMPPGRYEGLLAQPGMMARLAGPNQSSPVRRGVFVFDKMLCQPLPPPPADLNIVPPEPNPNATTRERFAVHSKNGICAGCHSMIDPMGFGVEEYDGVGAYRDHENGKPVDNTGEIVGAREATLNGKYAGARELGEKLGKSKQVHDCFATQYLRFALGRSEKPEDTCSVQQIQHAFYAGGGDFRSLLLSIATSDSFRFRSAPPASDVDTSTKGLELVTPNPNATGGTK